MRHLLIGLFLACLLPGAAAAPAPARDRAAALTAYQRDLVSVLVLRDDAQHLLGAALLARPLTDLPKGLDSPYLLDRAAHAPGAGPAVTWMQLAACDPEHACPNAAALAKLESEAPTNAAVWSVALDQALQQHDTDATHDALLKAAASDHYDDYAGTTLAALVAAATALPVPADALAAYAGKTAAGAASAQAFLALGTAGLHPRPALAPIVALCTADDDSAKPLHAPCLQFAHVLVWGSSPEARAAGLRIQQLLGADAAARTTAATGLADLAWQVKNYSRLSLDALTNQNQAVEWLRVAQRGGNEASIMSALLHRHGIALEAPASAGTTATPASASSRSATTAVSVPAPASTATAPPASAPTSPAAASSTP